MELAKRWKVSDQTVYDLRDDGMPCEKDLADGRYWFDFDACDRWRRRHIAETGHGGKRVGAGRKKTGAKSRRKARRGSGAITSSPLLTPATEGDDAGSLTGIAEEPSELKGVALQIEIQRKLQNTLLELQVAEKFGTVVLRATVISELQAVLSAMRKTVERMGPALAPQIMTVLAGKAGPEEQALIQRVIDDFGEKLLADLRAAPQVVGLLTPPPLPEPTIKGEGLAA